MRVVKVDSSQQHTPARTVRRTTMLQSAAVPEAFNLRVAHAARRPQVVVSPLVTLNVTVPSTLSTSGRRALQAALGADLRLFVVTTDKRHDSVTFRVEVQSHTLDEVLAALTSTLDQATIGPATITSIRKPL